MTEPIKSPQNEKLKLVRKLAQAKHRAREGLFLAEGEDLLGSARAAEQEPVELLTAAGSGLGGTEVEPELLDSVSTLASGTRVIGIWAQPAADLDLAEAEVAVYLHAVADPANVGAIVRSTKGLVDGTVVLGPGCADAYSPKAVRASMGAIFSQPVVRGGIEGTPAPRAALVAHGGDPVAALDQPATLCLGAEREGLPADVLAACQSQVTIPLRPGAESLNVAAAAAIALQRIGSRDA